MRTQCYAFCICNVSCQYFRFIIRAHYFIEQTKSCNNHRRSIWIVYQQFRTESRDSGNPSKVHLSGRSTAIRRRVKLITLYSVCLREIAEFFCFWIETSQSSVSAHPQTSEGVLQYPIEHIIGESVGCCIMLYCIFLFIIAVYSFTCSYPEHIILCFIHTVDKCSCQRRGWFNEVKGFYFSVFYFINA